MRIYEISTTATTAASGDKLMIDSGVSGAAKQITYAAFCLNQPAISTTGSITGASLTATSATVANLFATTAAAPASVTAAGTEGSVVFNGGSLYHNTGGKWWKYAGSTGW